MKKLYQVVDDDDQITGHKLRHEIDFINDNYRISALWLTNSRGEILLAKRVITKDKDPGKWGPAAAGTVEQDEDYESNIYKEAEEEIGLSGVKFKVGPKQRFINPRKSFCQWYTAVVDKEPNDFVLQADEVDAVKWVSKEWLTEDVRDNPENYVPSMRAVLELLG